MTLTTIVEPRTGAALDRALVVAFAADASVTGELVVELHLHGSSAVIAAVLDALGAMPQLRLAQPGEFTRQAFDNGKVDLTEVEGLADLIAATTEAQRVRALEAARGSLRAIVERWRAAITDMLVDVEAELDFAEEQADVATVAAIATHTARLFAIRSEVVALLARAHFSERLQDGFTVAIVGAPNVGKSSLINALVGRDASIVTALPGTTRDLIEVQLNVAGMPITLIDTAGLRDDASDPAEQEGIARARRRAAEADLVLHVAISPLDEVTGQLVINKVDLSGDTAGFHDNILFVSAASGAGIDALRKWLVDHAHAQLPAGESLLLVSRRQAETLEAFAAALAGSEHAELVLMADTLQAGLRALSRVSGRYYADDILDEVFARFCIGK